ncbi:MAG: patatin-like phospholipase family protein, partial [Phycisphaerae bacterium]|nr:patatin-like phospholipase family protein [Phycisphaerae bacterium]
MDVNTVLAKVGKRRLLALDGGRIRGMMSLQILKRIEKIVLEKELPGVTTLGDYFDYIAGTSTGAIIAACLARGMSVAEIEQFYKRCGPDMFVRANLLKRLSFTNKYESEPLAKKLREVLDENTTLDDPTLKCLLMMVLRNATTDSPWPLSNNPQAKYNNQGRDDCNLGLPLWQVVRASTAAPYFFPPESIEHGSTPFVFVDGGVTMYNNPAFQLFLMATLEPYRLQWKASEDDMLLVSVGTGSAAA